MGGTAPLGDSTSAAGAIFTVFHAIAVARTEIARTEDTPAVAGAGNAAVPILADFVADAAAIAGAGAEDTATPMPPDAMDRLTHQIVKM